MKITPWQTETTGTAPEDLSQEVRRIEDRPYPATWIVSEFKYDRLNRVYWVSGTFRESGEPFFWEIQTGRPLSWRYDLTNCTYSTGAHYFK